MVIYGVLFLVGAAALLLLTLPQLKGWRSMIFHGGVVVVGGAVPMFGQQIDFLRTVDWTQLISNKTELALVMMGLGVVGILLRYITTTPVGEK
jgi:hypothetical protein